MTWVVIGMSLYMTYYTFSYALSAWKAGYKLGGGAIFIMCACFIPLAWIVIR